MDGDNRQRAVPSNTPASPAEGTRESVEPRLGRVSLICAVAVWCGECAILFAEMGNIPQAVKLGGATLVAVGLCWLVAVVGGFVAAIGWRSRFGCVAVVMCLVLPLGVFALAVMTGGGWLD